MEKNTLLIFLSFVLSVISDSEFEQMKIPEDAFLNFTEIGRKYGFYVAEHDVVTEDGYILKLFNLRGFSKKPVFLMHGIIDTADTFIIRGPNSLAITLARAGYDVWAGNARGSRYSRRHLNLDPETNKQFWDFTFHEIGYYDLPAMIDYTLRATNWKKLSAIAHSQGTTNFYVMGSTRPDYNSKVDIMISMAPISSVANIQLPLRLAVQISPLINVLIMSLYGREEIFGRSGPFKTISNSLCLENRPTYELCTQELSLSAGSDPEELEPEFTPVVFGHYPSSTSRKNTLHTAQQGLRADMAQFDYGPYKNLKVYGTEKTPTYDLSKVTMKIALLVARNDKLSTLTDAKMLNKILPNVVLFYVLKRKKANHIDFVWGKNMDKYLYPVVFNTLHAFSE